MLSLSLGLVVKDGYMDQYEMSFMVKVISHDR